MAKFIAMHKTEPGYDSVESVQEFIDSADKPEDWRIVEIPEFGYSQVVTVKYLMDMRESAYVSGKNYEKNKIKSEMPEVFEQLNIYIGHDEGGCSDVGSIGLQGYVLISKQDLQKLQEDNLRLRNILVEAKSDYCHPNFTDRHGMCKRIKSVLEEL